MTGVRHRHVCFDGPVVAGYRPTPTLGPPITRFGIMHQPPTRTAPCLPAWLGQGASILRLAGLLVLSLHSPGTANQDVATLIRLTDFCPLLHPCSTYFTRSNTNTPRATGEPETTTEGCHIEVTVSLSPTSSNDRTCSVPFQAGFHAASTVVIHRFPSMRYLPV